MSIYVFNHRKSEISWILNFLDFSSKSIRAYKKKRKIIRVSNFIKATNNENRKLKRFKKNIFEIHTTFLLIKSNFLFHFLLSYTIFVFSIHQFNIVISVSPRLTLRMKKTSNKRRLFSNGRRVHFLLW